MFFGKKNEQIEDMQRQIDALEYREALREVRRLKKNANGNIPLPPSLMLVIERFENKYSANDCHMARWNF